MKHLLLTTIAAVVLVGCGESQQSAPAPEAKPVEPVAEAAKPKPPTGKAPDIDIHFAAMIGNLEAVKQHITAGADVNAIDDDEGMTQGMTPLYQAAAGGHKEIVVLLITEGADVNAKDDKFGMTPLLMAVVGIETVLAPVEKEIVELLIAKGADVNALIVSGPSEFKGKTALDLAKRHPELTDLLRKHGGKTGDWLNADKSIHSAARAGHIEAVKQHLAAGADVNAKLDRGYTALHYAAHEGHKEIAQLLIAAGADVNAKDDDGHAPLTQAAIDGHNEIAELLIEKGADVNATDEVGRTPLLFASANGRKEIVELLIGAGADVNAKVVSGAAQGKTPLDAANETNHPKTADLLRKHGGKTKKELEAGN